METYHGSGVYDPERYARLKPFGPFINPETFEIQPTTVRSLIIATVVFGLAMIFATTAAVTAVRHTKAARDPWRSAYIWMIWTELVACIAIAVECLLYLLYVIRPSFYFFMSILFLWAIQIHLLLQIIINRIRIILHDRQKGRIILIGVAVFISLINISVFCIWIPARLQINQRYIYINSIWDRVEKGLYLIVDGALNWYFIRVVKENLIVNGLQKYNRLVRYNQRIIVISLLMDVMIIAAMSIPNGFVYAIFHPLAFLVKLNIEMTMANLIRKIALENSHMQNTFLITFASQSSDSPRPNKSGSYTSRHLHRKWLSPHCNSNRQSLQLSRTPHEDGIVKTEEFSVSSARRSRLSSQLFHIPKAHVNQMENSSAPEVISIKSGDLSEQKRRESSAGSFRAGDEMQLVHPPATVRALSDKYDTKALLN